jgi:hypothetical protein
VAGGEEAPLAVQGLGYGAVQDKGQSVAEEVEGDEGVKELCGKDTIPHGQVADRSQGYGQRRQSAGGIENAAGRFIGVTCFQRHRKRLLSVGFGGVI